MPFFIYQSEPFLNEKHYPDINVNKIFENFENDNANKLPLLAMAGLFDINRNCDVLIIQRNFSKNKFFYYLNRLNHYIHVQYVQ
jgi:hypothetical protein